MNKIILNSYDGASASIFHHGAHVGSWIPAGEPEQLYMSPLAKVGDGAALRGGIPLIFPQFAAFGPLPKHGFARNLAWDFVRCGAGENGAATCLFELRESTSTQAHWPHAFLAELAISVQGKTLRLDFSVQNTGTETLQFTTALHTYFRVNDVEQTTVHGLQNLVYRDSVNSCNTVEKNEMVKLAGEVDRIYLNVKDDLEIRQSHQRIVLQQQGFNDAVLWNPGAAHQLNDLPQDEWQHFLCLEAACIRQPVQLVAQDRWTGSVVMTARAVQGN